MKLSEEFLQKVSMISWKNSMHGFRRRAVLRTISWKNSVKCVRRRAIWKKFHGPNQGKAYVGVFWQKSFTIKRLRICHCFASFCIFFISNFHIKFTGMKLSKEFLQKVSMISWKNSMNGLRRRAVLRKNSVDQIKSLNDILKKFHEWCRKTSYLKKFHGPNQGKAYVGLFWQKSFRIKRLRICRCFASFHIFFISNFHI